MLINWLNLSISILFSHLCQFTLLPSMQYLHLTNLLTFAEYNACAEKAHKKYIS